MGGVTGREEGCTKPVELLGPMIRGPQSLPQDVPESVGPLGCVALALRQQHFARFRQQDEPRPLSDWAASGTREANDMSSARLAATTQRAKRQL
jgi:hypothetical protein